VTFLNGVQSDYETALKEVAVWLMNYVGFKGRQKSQAIVLPDVNAARRYRKFCTVEMPYNWGRQSIKPHWDESLFEKTTYSGGPWLLIEEEKI